MLYITNTDVPGMIGFIGTTLRRAAGVNIANFQLGRDQQGGDAIALLYVDGETGLRGGASARTRCEAQILLRRRLFHAAQACVIKQRHAFAR
jgi:hypothetical protein